MRRAPPLRASRNLGASASPAAGRCDSHSSDSSLSGASTRPALSPSVGPSGRGISSAADAGIWGAGQRRRGGGVPPLAAVDYVASPSDEGVLQQPSKQELTPAEMVNVFGYPRDLRKRCVCPDFGSDD